MLNKEILLNGFLVLFCYIYILVIILISSKMEGLLPVSQKASRKFLHIMIGNLPFVIPLFTSTIYPVLVAAPFILVTFLASPHSPFKNVGRRLKGLSDITEEGHSLGLVFYAVSYTILAVFFASKPHVIAAGILPMAYGDSAASVVGERFGRRKYTVIAEKSVEGSLAMFFASFLSFTISLIYFSAFYPFSVVEKILSAFAVAVVAALVESVSPMGFDNLTVPIFSALTFLLLGGGV